MLQTNNLTGDQRTLLASLLKQLTQPEETEAPAEAAKPPKKKRRAGPETIKYFTQDEIRRFFAEVKSERDQAIFQLAYRRGLRATELGNLQFADVDWKAERIQLDRLKGSASGQFHLCSSEVRALKKWRRIRGDEPGPLFPTRQKRGNGKGITQQRLNQLVKEYGAAAGLPPEKCHTHVMKHSCATHLLERGESIEDVQDHLGHRNIQNTLKYAVFTNQRRSARDKRLRDW